LIAAAISLLVPFLRRKNLGKVLGSDLICLATVAAVLGVNMFLVLGRNLNCPYNNPIKYDYQFLPMFCLLAASLLNKLHSFDLEDLRGKQSKLVFLVTFTGLILVAASMIQNVTVLNGYVTQTGVLFTVEGEMGYSFEHATMNGVAAVSWVFQWLSFAIVVLSLVWANREKLKTLQTAFRQL
jgi:hypothetical protein